MRVSIQGCTLSASVPRNAIGRHLRIVTEGHITERAGAHVLFVQTSPTSYTWSVNAPKRGTLILNQGFDPHWTLTDGASRTRSAPAFSVTNSFPLSKGAHNGTISLAGSGSVARGIGLSGATFAGLLLIGFGPAPNSRRRPRRARRQRRPLRIRPIERRAPDFWAVLAGAVSIGLLLPASLAVGVVAGAAVLAVYRFAWWHLAIAAGAILLAAPALDELSAAAADTAALEALLLFTTSLAALAAAQRRRRR